MALMMDTILITVLAICLYTDLSKRKIYNIVVFPAAALGIALNTVWHGLPGLKFSAAGFCLGVAIFIIPYALGGMGAGDVKLLGTVGALKGPLFVFHAALGTALAGGLLALGILIWRRQLWGTVRRIALACALLLCPKRRIGEAFFLLERSPYSSFIPYGVAIFIGTLLAYWWGNPFAF